MTVRDRAANRCRESFDLDDEANTPKPVYQQMCQWRLKPHAA